MFSLNLSISLFSYWSLNAFDVLIIVLFSYGDFFQTVPGITSYGYYTRIHTLRYQINPKLKKILVFDPFFMDSSTEKLENARFESTWGFLASSVIHMT